MTSSARPTTQFKPSAILLDLMMPNVDGVALLEKLAEQGCAAKLLIMSGYHPELLNSSRRLGAATISTFAARCTSPSAWPSSRAPCVRSNSPGRSGDRAGRTLDRRRTAPRLGGLQAVALVGSAWLSGATDCRSMLTALIIA